MTPETNRNINARPTLILPGVWRVTLGEPEAITPVSTRKYAPATEALALLPAAGDCPVEVRGALTDRGFLVSVPLAADEAIYGLGLMLKSFEQRGKKKMLRVNADPVMDSGDSHAPAPFYVTTGGYGVLIDTARYATVYCGNKKRLQRTAATAPAGTGETVDALSGVYAAHAEGESETLVEVPRACGVDVYIFAGPTPGLAVQRYNLFSGGGALPPRWGLGFWYRVLSKFTQDEVLGVAAEMRERGIPCDVLGLEPGWQTKAYSCSFVWSDLYSDPPAMLESLAKDSFRVNLWEHAFTHPTSPIYEELLPHAGDYEVWGGLTPDFLVPEARDIFAGLHERDHVAPGVSGYKLDECDSSDFTGNWSFPEISRFPSGADGEQMHMLLGLRYQDAIQQVFEKRAQRTFGLARNTHALAAPYPYVIYSDLYDHSEFIRGVAQSSFSGILWTPEVRHATGPEDLIRRLQTVVFSPLAMINAWYLKNPPWKQVERQANHADDFSEGWEEVEAICRETISLRMRFLPVIHAAFCRYRREGLPPFRALVLDFPADRAVRKIDDQYMMGDGVMVAPMVAGKPQRDIYLPAGDWYDFWTGERLSGGQTISVEPPLERTPLYVRAGTILPLAEPTLHTDDPAGWRLTVRVYGDGSRPAVLFEEDGAFEPELTQVTLSWDSTAGQGRVERSGPRYGRQYEAVSWTTVG